MNTRRKSLVALLLLPLVLVIAFATAGMANASRDDAHATAAKTPTITISSFSYKVPATVQPGVRIKVVNNDSASHTVTADNGKFDVTIAANSKAFFKAPKKAGAYPFHCTFHSSMHGTLTVAK